jgi:hygromycin-B 7''-O-kinase
MGDRKADLDRLASLELEAGYREDFHNLEFWRPYLLEVCRRHGLTPTLPLQMGVPGTYPVFIAGGRWVIKFFGRLFDGEQSFWVEYELTSRLNQMADFPAPGLVAHGELFPDGEGWTWPYLILEYLPGVSFGEIGSILGRRVRLQLANELGGLVRRIHTVQAPSWEPYLQFLERQRASVRSRLAGWGWMPPALSAELEAFLAPPQALIDPGEQPHWIHADLTRDHLIGRWNHGEWTTLGLIDFGDGQIGSLYFELPALHLDFFERDGRLLAAFLDAFGYAWPQDAAFRRKALTACLLHPFDLLGPIWERWLSPNPPASLDELAFRLFNPGPVID